MAKKNEKKEESKKKNSSKKFDKEIKKKKIAVEDIEDGEEIDEDDFEEYDDEDEMIIDKKEKKESKKEVKKETKRVVIDENVEIKTLRILVVISIIISIISLIFSIIIFSKVNMIASHYDDGTNSAEEDSSDGESEEETEWDVSMFESIDADRMLEFFDKDDDKTYFVNVGRSSCPYSVQFLPSLQQSVEEYDYTLYYLDTSELDEKGDEIRKKSDVFEEDSTVLGSTPMVYAIKNGKVVDTNAGATEYSEYTAFLEKNGVKEK